jgi:hypothetical protein
LVRNEEASGRKSCGWSLIELTDACLIVRQGTPLAKLEEWSENIRNWKAVKALKLLVDPHVGPTKIVGRSDGSLVLKRRTHRASDPGQREQMPMPIENAPPDVTFLQPGKFFRVLYIVFTLN